MKKLAVAASAAFAGLEIGRFLKSSIDEASNLSESVSKVGVVFGDSAGEIQDWAKTASTSLGQSRQQALEAAGTFGNLFVAMKIGAPQAATMSKKMIELAGDLASFNNVSPEEALDALRSGLVGETEPLRRFGVNLNDATLKAKAMELGLSDGKSTLDANAKAQAAYALILEQTGTAQGDFARTSAGVANQQRILAAQWTDLKATIGSAFLPLLIESGRVLTTTLLPALQRFAELAGPKVTQALREFKAELDGIGVTPTGFFARAGDAVGIFIRLLKEGVTAAFHEAVDAVQAFADGFRNGIDIPGDPFDNIGRAARNIVEFLTNDLPGGIQAGVAAFKAGGDDITSSGFAGKMEEIGNKIRGVVDYVKNNQDFILPIVAGLSAFAGSLAAITEAQKALSAVQGISSLGASLAPIILAAGPIGLVVAAVAAVGVAAFVAYKKFQPFRDIVDNVARTIRDVAVVAFHALVDAAVAVGNFVGTAFEAVRNAVDVVMAKFSAFGALLGSLFAVVVVALTPLAQWINDNVVATINAGLELIAAVIERVFGIVSNSVAMILAVLQPVFAALKTEFEVFAIVATAVLQVLATVIADTVAFWVAAFRTFIDVVTPIWEVFFQNMLTVAQTVINIILTVIETVLGVIRGVFQVFTGLISGDWSKLWEGVRTIVSSLFGAVTGIVNAIWAGILGIFANSIAGVQNTVTNGFNAVVAFVSGIPGRIASTLGGLSGILFGAGQAIIEGLLNGIRSMASAAANAAKQVVQGAINAAKSVLGIGSPSKVFAEIGVNVGQGFVVGVQKTGGMVDGAISNLLGVGTQRFATASNLNLPPIQAAPGGGVGGGSPTINIYAPLGVDRQEVISSVQAGLRQYNSARAGTR